ncbi:MAG: metallophosphoesterase [Pigmentiphaga sp.]|uniref:metallophosphoesterase family protein n=1 Tax=Pigmentiphaga sp. TaxID=1977564 RepID=UPI0029A7E63F|nr:metallophosphoesterase [Pigmentiphaga sp.]MDX3905978.1 metallophosphoesterase [Pigmentiphaga sp.]
MSRQPLFRFAVIADSHVNPSEHDRISPFESHRLTNARLRHTVRTLNGLRPAFVMHVGDMIHPVPEAVSYPQAAEQFRQAVAQLECPIHLVPGNHDVGDKLADYVPAGAIRPDYLELYSRHFGRHFYSFDAHGCHFVVINTSLINSGLPQEQEQARWLEADLAANQGGRCFLFMHYPPFVATEDEHGHYDNIDPPGRAWLLDVVARHGVAVAFTGHVHNFFVNRHAGTFFYLMPSTAFVRADYAEALHAGQPPEHELGRNDAAKLGVMVVDVYEDAVVPQFVRTFGMSRAGDEVLPQRDWPRLPPAAGELPTLGLELRYGWTALYDIPYSSMLDEFRRKRARNDYPILALWEMGVRKLRVPLDDLLDDSARKRMEILAASGGRFTVFHFGMPNDAELDRIRQSRGAVEGLELILKWPPAPDLKARLIAIRDRAGVPLVLSRFWNASGESRDGKQIKLLVDHGFTCNDDKLPALLGAAGAESVQGIVFRIDRETAARTGIEQAVAAAERAGLRAQVHMRLADDSPARARCDEWSNTSRVLEAALCSHYYRGHTIFLDTLSDVDRGYFPRVGLIDRLGNPRRAGRSLRNLNGALSELPPLQSLCWHEIRQGLVGVAQAGDAWVVLALKPVPDAAWSVDLPTEVGGGSARRIDLETGAESMLEVHAGGSLQCEAGGLLWVVRPRS